MINIGENTGKTAKKYWPGAVIFGLALVFFLATSSYNYLSQDRNFTKWASPDETANYVFAKLYGQTGDLRIFEKYNLYADDIMHPRSFRSDNGQLKPVSFLGIILIYGWIVKLAGYKVLPYLTPFFAALGIIFFYLLVKKIFGQRNAFLSAFLLAGFPPYIYYSVRGLFHNVLFMVLLITGFYFAYLAVEGVGKNTNSTNYKRIKLMLFMALGGGFIGLAIITRTSELLWLGPVLFIVWIFNIRKIGLAKLLIFLSFLSLALLPAGYWNQILYGNFWHSGYPELNQSVINITQAGADLVKSTAAGELSYHRDLFLKIKESVFYFGFHAKNSLKMFYYYFVGMFAWLFWPAFLGLILWLQDIYKWKKKHLVYFLSLAVATLILVFYYGSWEFHDNPNPKSFTIGNSYTRYWLLIYLGCLPLVSLFLLRFTRALCAHSNLRIHSNLQMNSNLQMDANGGGYLKKIKDKYFKLPEKMFLVRASRAVIVILIYFVSVSFVLFGSEEGLLYSIEKNREARQEFDKVMSLTESSAVIITQYHDKLFFPERKVIVGLFNDDSMNKRYARLTNYLPVYYYNFTFPEKDINYLNEKKLPLAGLKIEEAEKVGDFSLYKLEKTKN